MSNFPPLAPGWEWRPVFFPMRIPGPTYNQILPPNPSQPPTAPYSDPDSEPDRRLVTAFNTLPRPYFTPNSRVLNLWNFSIETIRLPSCPRRQMLILVRAGITVDDQIDERAELLHVEGGALPFGFSATYAERAAVITPMLLNAFVSALGSDLENEAIAPFGWNTADPELAKAVERELWRMGVKQALACVGIRQEIEGRILERLRYVLVDWLWTMYRANDALREELREWIDADGPVEGD